MKPAWGLWLALAWPCWAQGPSPEGPSPILPAPVRIEDALAKASQPIPWDQTGTFLKGAGAAFLLHEGGHLATSILLGAHVGTRAVKGAGIPFFAVTHTPYLSPHKEFAISSAGFWTQHATSEWILAKHPHLREESDPFLKGVFAFNLATSLVYAVGASSRTGPQERDTLGMATALKVDERWVGAMVLVPALLDGYRYFHPEAAWAKWTSRSFKVAMVLLVFVVPKK